NVRLPDDVPALPENATKLPTNPGEPARYFDGDGNVLDQHGNVLDSIDNAPKEGSPNVDRPAGSDVPHVDADSPAKVPAMAGAAVHAADNAGHVRLGGSFDLADAGRLGDDATTPSGHVGDAPGGHAPGGTADHLPGGTAHDLGHGPSAGHEPPSGGSHPGGHGDGPAGEHDGPPSGGHDGPGAGGHEGHPGAHGEGPGGHETPGGTGGESGPGGGGPDGPEVPHGPGGPDGPEGWERHPDDSGPLERGSETEQQVRDQVRGTAVKHGDVDRILDNLADHPAGREIADTIASGRFRDAPNFSNVVSALTGKGEISGCLEQIRLANRLHDSGLTDISFEIKQGGHEIKPGVFTEPKTDLDLMARDADGNVHGWQFKDMTGPDSPADPAKVTRNIFKKIGQLTDSHADVQTFVVETKASRAEMATQIGRFQKGYDFDGVQFVVRSPDGILFVPRDGGTFMPEGTL
ncbi:hypothetical protein ABT381_29375, partial [Streptomyces sp. NPDC000151]